MSTAIEALGYSNTDGLVVTGGEQPEDLATRFVWNEIEQKVSVDAVFFHSGVPLVGFTSATAANLGGLRRQLWNYGRLPALIAVDERSHVTVYNALRSPLDSSGSGGVLASGSLTGDDDALVSFRRREIESGALDREFGDHFRTGDRVDSVLLTNLRFLRRELAHNGDRAVSSHADIVIGASILAAYLANRGVLTSEHLDSICRERSLVATLEAGRQRYSALLTGLAERFNGDVFGPAAESVSRLQNTDLEWVARFLSGENLATGQVALWPYDFSVIPPEVISSVYETLLEEDREKHASFYTPRSVVNLILDEVIPLNQDFEGSIADLSCGSGAFLTEAFRRLVFQRRVQGHPVDFGALSELLADRIFGIDVDDFATRLTIFGLYLALLEEVEPRTIWDEVVLPRLYMRSVVSADAFSNHLLRTRRFDVVVGNPPWKSALSSDAVTFLHARGRQVGDNQLAQGFVWLAESMLQTNGRLGLVLPAKSSLYNRSGPNRQFRADLFKRLRVRTVVDLSLVRRHLFSGAIGPSAVIVADLHTDSELAEPGTYLAVRPRSGSGVGDGFVVAPEDFKEFPSHLPSGEDFSWKVYLWGSRRDLALLRRLQSSFDPLERLKEDHGWRVAQGIKVGGATQSDASHLIGLPMLNQRAIAQLSRPKVGQPFSRRTLHRSQDRGFFESPKVVLSRTLVRGHIAATLIGEPAVFTSNLTGVCTRNGETEALSLFALISSSALIQYWQFFTSASWGVERPSIETNEILGWPIPELTPERIERAHKMWLDIRKSGGLSDKNRVRLEDFVAELYGLTWSERLLVDEGVARSLGADRPASLFGFPVTNTQLKAYGEALTAHLSHGWVSAEATAASRRQGGYAGVKVHFGGESQDAEWSVAEWARAIGAVERPSSTTAVIAQPALLFFEGANAYVVKSLDADRWSRAAALSDGDEIYSAAVFGADVAR